MIQLDFSMGMNIFHSGMNPQHSGMSMSPSHSGMSLLPSGTIIRDPIGSEFTVVCIVYTHVYGIINYTGDQ